MTENLVVSIFEVESEAYQAMTILKQSPILEDTFVKQAVLVKKDGDDIKDLDYFDTGADTMDGFALGGMLGALVGVLGGPIGVLLGASYGMLAGGSVDALDALDNASLIEQIIDKLQDGEVAIIALVNEEDESILDKSLENYKTITARFDAAVVAAEVEEAMETEKELERQARAALRKEKSDEFKSKVEKHRAKLKAFFSGE